MVLYKIARGLECKELVSALVFTAPKPYFQEEALKYGLQEILKDDPLLGERLFLSNGKGESGLERAFSALKAERSLDYTEGQPYLSVPLESRAVLRSNLGKTLQLIQLLDFAAEVWKAAEKYAGSNNPPLKD